MDLQRAGACMDSAGHLIGFDTKGQINIQGRVLGRDCENLVGQIYGCQQVIAFHSIDRFRLRKWLCKCLVCGTESPFRSNWLKQGASCHNCYAIANKKEKYGNFVLSRSDVQRFHSGYIPVTESGCWLWDGCTYKGYGVMGVRTDGRSTSELAHRISWALHYGEIPDGLFVCHKCDIPACVNPHHLFLGTANDNTQDMVSKGRQAKGVIKPGSKLTDQDVIEIRDLYKVFAQHKIAPLYGISNFTVSQIIRRKKWKHVL